ncbi:PREDICTED: uncharacterized protein LOC104826235 [Tarenaya hassleriana]|uniref:uncharacterized protein LOC104826235 n=1 Tax=Tarenaya hassleriana TaxID=28532 RepID=UPI00053C8143|nr:PREDICTED: uncharacterized protein LOC104826235 [Tarenaya hassleriana]
MDALLDKAASAVDQVKQRVSASAEKAKGTVETAKTEASSTVSHARETLEASVETVKAEASSAPKKLADSLLPQVKDAVDGAVSRGIEGAKSLLHSLEEKKGEVSSKLVEAVKHAAAGVSGSADSAASRDVTVSADNQPLLASGERAVESTPWWKNCCGVLDLLKTSAT